MFILAVSLWLKPERNQFRITRNELVLLFLVTGTELGYVLACPCPLSFLFLNFYGDPELGAPGTRIVNVFNTAAWLFIDES